jgi:hypothetical protein
VTSTPASRTPASVVRHRRKLSPKPFKQTRQVAIPQAEDVPVESADQKNLDVNDVRPASTIIHVVPTTPQAVRREVPSSQTPASIKLSAENSPGKREELNRSPLRKHASVADQEAAVQEMRLDDIDLQHSLSKSARKSRPAQAKAAMSQTSTQASSRQAERERPRTPRTSIMRHLSTVEDSDEELELSAPSLTADQDQLQSALEESIRLRDYTQFQPSNAFTQYPQTYDPVSAALNRDAARFEDESQTQSLANLTGAPTPSSQNPHRPQPQTRRTPTGKAHSIIPSSSPSLIPSSPYINPRNASDSSLAIVISSSAPPMPESDDVTLTIPDSPRVVGAVTPRIRTSQMSTVVPSSPAELLARLNSARKSPDRQETFEETPRQQDTTTKSAQQAGAILTSSPIPLPPWSEDEMQAGVQRRDLIPGDDELFDESLPPPPPGWLFTRDGGGDLNMNRR